ncbi:MAG: hypothetical protein F4X55_06740 [Candidatus Dadabacteria bacterium]|nr:hypothetical protein [Candidatus Dadabacteria bacterium]
MISSEFLEFVSSVKSRLGSYPSEESVSVQIVLPVLGHLGWDIHSPDYVCPQYPLDRRKVDYGLKISKGNREGLRCIIEVKAEGNLDADHQLFQYAFLAGAPLAVLTDGRHWRFYLPMVPGKFEERLVRTLDFGKHSHEEIVNGLVRYLSFQNTRSGKAKENAERDHNQRIKSIETRKNISMAWENLLDGSSDELVTLLIEETSRISSGYAPARSDVEEFLRSIQNVERSLKVHSEIKPKIPKDQKRFQRRATGRKPSFLLLGEEYLGQDTIASAFTKIIEILAERDKNFLTLLAPEVEGRKNKQLSRNLADLGDYDVAQKTARRLPGGWWLKTHSSTDRKVRILRKACKIAGIPFGKSSGLKLEF